MAEFGELVGALTWLLANRIQQKTEYTHGLLGDGIGNVRVSADPDSPDVDFVFVRPDRSSNRTYKIFNKRVQGEDGDPIIIGELPWEPNLFQVIDLDWAAYKNVGWGEYAPNVTYHGKAHEWRDGAPGLDAFNVYRRQLGDLKAVPSVSGTSAIDISSYSIELFGSQKQFAGITAFPLDDAIPAGTGTARMALIYWDPSSGSTGALGVSTGTLGIDTDATLLNRAVSPAGTIPVAHVRLAGGISSISEADIWDAREPFRPGLSFGTGSAGLSADMIPISDTVGFYTGSTVEAALMETPYKLIAPDGSINPVLSADALGDVTLAGTGTLFIPELLSHSGDPDTYWSFAADDIEAFAGSISMLKLTEAAQDVVAIGDVAGTGDVDIDFSNGQMLLQGSSGRMAINTTIDSEVRLNIIDVSTTTGSRDMALHAEIDTENDTTAVYVSHAVRAINRYRGTQGSTSPTGPNAYTAQMFCYNTGTTSKISGFRLDQRNLGAGTVTAMSGILIDTMQNSGGGAVTSTFGVRIEAQTAGTNNFGIYQLGSGSDNFLAGSLGVGVVFPLAKAHIDQASTTAAIPTLSLDQADLSEEFINFISTIGAGNPIDTAAIGTYYGKIRVAVNGTFKYVALYNS